jgi:hypothetical protein
LSTNAIKLKAAAVLPKNQCCSLLADGGARLHVRADIEQDVEVASVGGLAAGQVEGND